MIRYALLAGLAAVYFLSAVPRRLPPLVVCECGRRWRSWDPMRRCGRCQREGAAERGLLPARGQMPELPGETFEDAFGRADA